VRQVGQPDRLAGRTAGGAQRAEAGAQRQAGLGLVAGLFELPGLEGGAALARGVEGLDAGRCGLQPAVQGGGVLRQQARQFRRDGGCGQGAGDHDEHGGDCSARAG